MEKGKSGLKRNINTTPNPLSPIASSIFLYWSPNFSVANFFIASLATYREIRNATTAATVAELTTINVPSYAPNNAPALIVNGNAGTPSISKTKYPNANNKGPFTGPSESKYEAYPNKLSVIGSLKYTEQTNIPTMTIPNVISVISEFVSSSSSPMESWEMSTISFFPKLLSNSPGDCCCITLLLFSEASLSSSRESNIALFTERRSRFLLFFVAILL